MLIRQITRPGQPEKSQKAPAQIHVRSDLRAGNDDCELGIQYWREEYNDIKKQAQAIGCPV